MRHAQASFTRSTTSVCQLHPFARACTSGPLHGLLLALGIVLACVQLNARSLSGNELDLLPARTTPIAVHQVVAGDTRPASSTQPGLQQFTAAGHVLGFASDHLLVAGLDHLLKVEFLDANPVQPRAPSSANGEGNRAPPFAGMRYEGLWPGVELSYREARSGLMESVYRIQPGADTDRIRLGYNRPLRLTAQGELEIAFDQGTLRESAPVAWQVIDGRRQPVEVAFVQRAPRQIGLRVGTHDPSQELWIDPEMSWNTLLGSSGYNSNDSARGIARDGSGNLYVTGVTASAWGTPLNDYSSSTDAYVAKFLASDGSRSWHTFIGGTGVDAGSGIALDASGNPLIVGTSNASWGSPKRAFTGGDDLFVAKLSGSDGSLTWSTFLGGYSYETGYGIAVDASGNALIAGSSYGSWGSPVVDLSGAEDGFVAKVDGSTGSLLWHTFIGGGGYDSCRGLVVNAAGDALVVGIAGDGWGSPVAAYAGGGDAFAARFSGSDGSLSWLTFLGGASYDAGHAIALFSGGDLVVAGQSGSDWGSPVTNHSGGSYDLFAARLSASTGARIWNTFVGGSSADNTFGVAVDSNDAVLLIGEAGATWDSPTNAFGSGVEGVVAKLASDGSYSWHTFFGGPNYDRGYALVTDTSNDVYIAAASDGSWGSPVVPHADVTGSSSQDGAVAKLAALDGGLTWNTFVGGQIYDSGQGLVVNDAGEVFVTGSSLTSWGTPINDHAGGYEAFVVKLNAGGTRAWNTFLGGSGTDHGNGIALDSSGNLLVTGTSDSGWGSPILGHSGDADAFVAKLNATNGSLIWNTFLGTIGDDIGQATGGDGFGNVLVVGSSSTDWGTPQRPKDVGLDTFVAKLDGDGGLIWNTFLGGGGTDIGTALAVDDTGDPVVAGYSDSTWGDNPITGFNGYVDAFVAHLSASNGALVWHTFVGGYHYDSASGIALDSIGDILITGFSLDSWGTSPVRPFSSNKDAFVAKLGGGNGSLQWNTFLGTSFDDQGNGIATDTNGDAWVVGTSQSSWGEPVHRHADSFEAFVARINGSDGSLAWNSFVGGYLRDHGNAVTRGSFGEVLITGDTDTIWGAPVGWDSPINASKVMVARLVYHSVTPSAGSNGDISPNTIQVVDAGDMPIFQLQPNTNYEAQVGGSCGGLLLSDSFTTDPVYADCTVEASFSLITHAITETASPTVGGTIACSPNPVVNSDNATCTAQPNDGYVFLDFSGDCSGATCQLTNVTSAKSVTANFGLIVTGACGSSDGGSFASTPGSNLCATGTASGVSGSGPWNWSCTGQNGGGSDSCSAELLTHAITTSASPAAGGSISCTPNPVVDGNSVNCTATAASGYSFVGFSGACSGTNCTLTNVTSPKSVTAQFEPADTSCGATQLVGPVTFSSKHLVQAETTLATSGAVLVPNGTQAAFHAGSSVKLNTGFSAVSGSRFEARVTPVSCN